MQKYLAQYTVNALEFDGACWRPFLEPDNLEYNFEAKNDEEAKKIAEEHMKTFKEKYFRPQSTLDSLLKVEDVKNSS